MAMVSQALCFFVEEVTMVKEEGMAVEFGKAMDKVPHGRLIQNIKMHQQGSLIGLDSEIGYS